MDLLIFSKAPGAYEPSRLREESAKAGLSAEIIAYSDLDFIVGEESTEVLHRGGKLPGAKIIIFRSAGGGSGFYIPQRDFLINFYQGPGAKVLNLKTYKTWSRLDKITQHFEFQRARLPFIESRVFGNNEHLLEETRDFPLIIKKNLSSRGRDVFKVYSLSDIRGIFDGGYFAREMLLQPFLKIGQDLRIIVVGGKAMGAMRRTALSGKYLTNYSQGGMIEGYDLEKDLEAKLIAEKTARHFLLDYVGVDLMKSDNGRWKVLEINRSCQFKGFETATGLNVAREVVKFLSAT